MKKYIGEEKDMKKTIFVMIIAAILIAIPVHAEIETYEDEFVSFDYDDSVLAIKTYHFYPGTMYYIQYTRDDSLISANVSILLADKNSEFQKDLRGDKDRLTNSYMLRRGHEFCRVFDDELDYYRLLCETDTGYLFVVMETNDDTSNAYDLATITYDSASCTDLFRNEGFRASDDYSKAR